MPITRRAVLAAALSTPAVAYAQTAPSPEILRHPAMAAWTQPARTPDRVLAAQIEQENGQRIAIRDYLGGPGVLAVWATWCPPCVAEKPPMAALQSTLSESGARAHVKAVLAFDNTPLPQARARLRQLDAGGLENAQALSTTEIALIRLFGFRVNGSMHGVGRLQQMVGSSLPMTMLFDANANLLGTHVGSMRRGYWQEPATFDLLRSL